MSPETIGVLATAIGLGGLLIGLFAWLRQDIRRMDERFDRVDERFDRMDDRITVFVRDNQERFVSLDRGQAELRERMAKLEDLLEGLRESVTGRREAS